jgi:hypothetical protein
LSGISIPKCAKALPHKANTINTVNTVVRNACIFPPHPGSNNGWHHIFLGSMGQARIKKSYKNCLIQSDCFWPDFVDTLLHAQRFSRFFGFAWDQHFTGRPRGPLAI